MANSPVRIPYFLAQGAGNDFLLSWRDDVPPGVELAGMARAICDRKFGIGGDGWYIMSRNSQADAAIHLYNSDGSEAELSGNGTRCAAAVLVDTGLVSSGLVRFKTGAGFRELRMLARDGNKYQFEMTMGRPVVQALHFPLAVEGKTIDSALIDVGNPQCAISLQAIGHSSFDFDWQTLGATIEGHAYFPRRTNVSFFSRIGANVIGARFYERGAGATLSSGTGATGAAVAAKALGMVEGPITVKTEAGDLQIRWENDDVFLAGPAQVISRGEYYGG